VVDQDRFYRSGEKVVVSFIFFACPKKTNQQRSGERKGTRSLAASLLSRRWRDYQHTKLLMIDTLRFSKLPGV
jgi:hypothetical protein